MVDAFNLTTPTGPVLARDRPVTPEMGYEGAWDMVWPSLAWILVLTLFTSAPVASSRVAAPILGAFVRTSGIGPINCADDACDSGALFPRASGDFPSTGEIAFGAQIDGHWGIYAFDIESETTTKLIDESNIDEFAPAYSHRGDRLAFVSDAEDGINQVLTMAPDGSDLQQATDYHEGGEISHVAWSGDDKQLLVSIAADAGHPDQAWRLYTVRARGTKPGKLSPFTPQPSAWASASNDRIVYGAFSDQTNTSDLFLSDANGRNIKAVFKTEFDETCPNLSSDGKWIAFQVGPQDNTHIEVVRPDGTKRHVIVGSSDNDGNPIWSPNGGWIAYVAVVNGTAGIWIVQATGGDPKALSLDVESEAIWYLSWRDVPENTKDS